MDSLFDKPTTKIKDDKFFFTKSFSSQTTPQILAAPYQKNIPIVLKKINSPHIIFLSPEEFFKEENITDHDNFELSKFFQTETSSKLSKTIIELNNKVDSIMMGITFKTTQQLINHLEKNLKISQEDRFFIYPQMPINRTYYMKKFYNKHNKISSGFNLNLYLRNEKNFQQLKNHKENTFNLSFLNFEFLSEISEKLEKLRFKESQILTKVIGLENELMLKEEENKETNIKKDKILFDMIQSEEWRKTLHEYSQNIKGNIRVFCRVKPVPFNNESIIKYPDCSLNELFSMELKNISAKNSETLNFCFDKIFTEKISQEEVQNKFS
jgi:hypothetical protein